MGKRVLIDQLKSSPAINIGYSTVIMAKRVISVVVIIFFMYVILISLIVLIIISYL